VDDALCSDTSALLVVPRYCPNGCPAYNVLQYSRSRNGNVPLDRDVYVHHADAAKVFRKTTTAPFFANQLACLERGVGASQLLKLTNELAAQRLGVTLEILNAAPGQLPYFNMTAVVGAVVGGV